MKRVDTGLIRGFDKLVVLFTYYFIDYIANVVSGYRITLKDIFLIYCSFYRLRFRDQEPFFLMFVVT